MFFLEPPPPKKNRNCNLTLKFAKTAFFHVLWSSALTVTLYVTIYIDGHPICDYIH